MNGRDETGRSGQSQSPEWGKMGEEGTQQDRIRETRWKMTERVWT